MEADNMFPLVAFWGSCCPPCLKEFHFTCSTAGAVFPFVIYPPRISKSSVFQGNKKKSNLLLTEMLSSRNALVDNLPAC